MAASQRSQNTAGSWSLALGIGSAVSLFLPAFGDYIAFVCIVGAFWAGYRGIVSFEKKETTHRWGAVFGIVCAAIVLFLIIVMRMSAGH